MPSDDDGEITALNGTRIKTNQACEVKLSLMQINAGPSAAATVFSITELLEVILIEVGDDLAGMKSLFVLQAENKTFKRTIKKSTKLRRIMFRKGTVTKDDKEPVWNPLLFDKSVHSVLYPAVFDEWIPDSMHIEPSPTCPAPCGCLTFEHHVPAPLIVLPIGPPGSWRELKLCHSSFVRLVNAAVDDYQGGTSFCSGGTDIKLGDFAERVIFEPIREEMESNGYWAESVHRRRTWREVNDFYQSGIRQTRCYCEVNMKFSSFEQ